MIQYILQFSYHLLDNIEISHLKFIAIRKVLQHRHDICFYAFEQGQLRVIDFYNLEKTKFSNVFHAIYVVFGLIRYLLWFKYSLFF